jgi:hypothetical protein
MNGDMQLGLASEILTTQGSSANGTFETCQPTLTMSAYRGRTEVIVVSQK